MSYRVRAAIAIGKRRILESLIHPGIYVAVVLGLLALLGFAAAFVRSVDSSGFNVSLGPLYGFVGGLLTGAFGEALLPRVFAAGPLLFSLHIAFFPVLFYLSMSSVYRFGSEKNSGMIELLSYGPSDGTAYFFAAMGKDAALTAAALLLYLLFFLVVAAVENLAIDPTLLVSLPLLLCTALSVYAYGVLASVMTESANSALALFLLVFLLFMLSLIGSYAAVGGYVHSLATVAAWCIQWISPFFYWSLGMRADMNGEAGLFLASLAGQLILCGAALAASHCTIRARGIRG